jgi:hypothetical protein
MEKLAKQIISIGKQNTSDMKSRKETVKRSAIGMRINFEKEKPTEFFIQVSRQQALEESEWTQF